MALTWAVRQGIIVRNPCDLDEPPAYRPRVVQSLTLEQARELLKASANERLGALYVLALLTGLRQGELFGLKWSDVDLEAGTLSVVRSLKEHQDGRVTEELPKTDAGRRLVVNPWPALDALRAHRAKFPDAVGYVFLAQKGGPLRKSVFSRKELHPFTERCGLKGTTFHMLRHTAASLRMQAGVHGRVVQETLGHASIGTTLGTYSHVAPSMQREAADSIGDLLAGSGVVS